MRRLILLVLAALAICAPAFSASARSHVDPVKVRHELSRIMAAPEYNRSTAQSAFEKWLVRAGNSIRRGVKSMVAWVTRHLSLSDPSQPGVAAVAGAWAVVLGFLALLGLVIRKLIRRDGRGRSRAASLSGESYAIPTASGMIAQAAKLAEAGDYRGAFKAAYVASIAHLDEVQALRFERSRTNWEYLRELRSTGREETLRELRPLTLDFDRKIYGRESCTIDDYHRAVSVHERLSAGEAK